MNIKNIPISVHHKNLTNLIHSDHNYMTLAALEVLPEKMQNIIQNETGLLVRWFCELPDFYWELFGTLGEWEIDNDFCFDWRRNLKASQYLGCNPVTGEGIRHGHTRTGVQKACPKLLKKSVEMLSAGNLRNGLAYAGAACHYIQDSVTFPIQQSLHRREMAKFEDISIPKYTPKIIFKCLADIPETITNIFKGEPDTIIETATLDIRQCIREGNEYIKRRTAQLKCDNLGAKLTSDIIFSVLQFYKKKPDSSLNISYDFTNIDTERLPNGYFIDRDNSAIFQGYVSAEGLLRRGYDKRKTAGLQLRFSATGNSEVRWKQSIVDAINITPKTEYDFNFEVYRDTITGENGCNLLFWDNCWEICETRKLTCNNGSGWEKISEKFSTPKSAIAVTADFYSKNNKGTLLVDNWNLRKKQILNTKKKEPIKKDLDFRLILTPGNNYNIRDLSPFSNQNEPITSIAGAWPKKISNGEEFVFDGANNFIEIPYHSIYQPLLVKDILVINLEFLPENIMEGELIMSSVFNEQKKGWRLSLINKHIALTLYGDNRSWICKLNAMEVIKDKWNSLKCEIYPNNKCKLILNGHSTTNKAPFSREYCDAGHYIGSDFGVINFFKGKMKNIKIYSNPTI